MSEHEDHLSSRDYTRLCGLIYDVAGIRLGAEKKTMLEARIRRRLRALSCSSYASFCDRLFRNGNAHEEIVHFIDVVTTNKTDFFREPDHFKLLEEGARRVEWSLSGPASSPDLECGMFVRRRTLHAGDVVE